MADTPAQPATPPNGVAAPPASPPPAAAPPRVNEEEKRAREAAFALKRQQEQWKQQQQAAEADLKRRQQEFEQQQAQFQQARQVGVRDLEGMFTAAGIPPEARLAKVSEWQMQLMREGKVSADPNAPVSAVEARVQQLEAQVRKQAEDYEKRAQELAQREEQMRVQQWYGNLERDVTASPDCKLTKIPYLRIALDQTLADYEKEHQLDYRPVFAEKAKAVEAQLANELAGAGWFRVEGDTVYAADGSVKGKIAAPPPMGAPPALPGQQSPPVAGDDATRYAAILSGHPVNVPTPDTQQIITGIKPPGPMMPPVGGRTLDASEGVNPGGPAPLVFGNVRTKGSDNPVERLKQIQAAQGAANGGRPAGT